MGFGSFSHGYLKTYTRATVVFGPGSDLRTGKGVSAQACSTSLLERPAGKVDLPLNGLI